MSTNKESPRNHASNIENGYNQGNVVYMNQQQYEYDNSACLYCSACMSLFMPLIGIVTIIIYLLGCMQPNRSPREKTAFIVLVFTTIINLLITIFVIASR